MKLDEVCELIVDCPHTTAPDIGKGYPLIRTPNIGRGKLLLDGVHRVNEQTYNERNKRAVPQDYDLIFAREAPAGNVAIIKNGEKVCLGQRTVLLRPNQELANPDFLVYFLLAPKQQHGLLGTANGVTVPHVNMSTIRNLEVSIPSVATQNRIADILCAYDDLIENNQKQIKLLEEAAMRLYKKWFVNLRFPGCETTKVVDGVPEGWSRKKLIDIADITMGQSPKSEYYNDRQQGLPFHQGVTNYGYRFVIDETYSTSYTRIAGAGSILFSVRAPVGRMNITKNKIVIGRGLAAINHREGLQSFLFYMLKNRFYKDDLIGNGAIYASITKAALYSQEFLIPSDDLADEFNVIAKEIDQCITNADRQIILLQQARDRLLPKLMSGEIEIQPYERGDI